MRGSARWLATACGAAALVACGGGGRAERAPFRAVWVTADSAPLAAGEARRLVAAGASELFVEAGRLAWAGERAEIAAATLQPIPRPVPATLVVTGSWSASGESPRRLATAWRASLDRLALALRDAGAVPVGVHFEVDPGGAAESFAATLGRLRRTLRGDLHVSVSLAPERLGEESARELAAAVDFVVVDVFGRAPDALDDPRSWDRETARERLAQLERLGSPYAAAVWTLGAAELRRRSGEATPIRAGLPLSRLLRSASFAVRPGSVFEGVDRQIFVLEPREATPLGPWTLGRGDALRVTRPTTYDVERLLDVLSVPALERCLGLVFRAVPSAGDTVSLAAVNLAAALEPGDARPALAVALVDAGSARGRTRLRVRLTNASAETSELGGGEWNYVQLEFAAGVLGTVDPGDFAGWEQLWRGSERRTLRALRQADTLRLFAPFVGAGERLESGTIELRGRASALPEVRTSGRFILPGGREHRLPETPATWIVNGTGGGSE